ncbi:hypothetical protein MANES_15G188721v8 [Manihot esculenta]|uniref:Uncharacterized protein n=1 Tax=Manihot esculenta TaxID=3983 RepID=A0ACB7GCS0_MANES|nr:hypothetical protein MANES_15G188721v8 [Manihot esculenta]
MMKLFLWLASVETFIELTLSAMKNIADQID